MILHAAVICHDDSLYLPATLAALPGIPATVFVNEIAWNGAPSGDWLATVRAAKQAGAEVQTGRWPDEARHRGAVLDWARSQGTEWLLIPDSDEIVSPELLAALTKIATVDLADVVHCTMDTYWKSPEYVIRPREKLLPAILIKPAEVQHVHIRDFRGYRPLMLSEEHGVLHHLSYAGPPERILRKINTWSHRDEVVADWWPNIWERWDGERTLRELHPTHPFAYNHTECIPVPKVLKSAWDAYLEASGGIDPLRAPKLEPDEGWPKVSVVIPLYGGREDLQRCLGSLAASKDLLHEVVVVDDRSPDDAPSVVQNYDFAKLIENTENVGFAQTCNRGADETTGEVILFLNSDTVVPRESLIRLIQSLMVSGVVGASGPVSNAVGHFQQVPITLGSLDLLPRFAEDYAFGDVGDTDHDMLVGFCLAVRRSAWEEVGPFDTQFTVGMFEDNDLCYRLRRAGYRLVVSRRSFVYHRGNASLDRHPIDKRAVFSANQARYLAKWREDLEYGFASHLAGMAAERIVFDHSRQIERMHTRIDELARQSNVSLCMIVRNEERVLAQCLESAKPFFTQIVIVDTGSTDRTIEIAKSFGAEVHEMIWPDSFAGARNESLRCATGDWICWLDADDTLPFLSGEAMLNAVIQAPEHIGGLIMPVRFVNDDPEFGTSVDHVKVFRNGKGCRFEHRIHEQILPSIRAAGFDIARLQADVLHSGYDTSEEGQAKKRIRDDKLLKLDLEDHPNHPFVLFNLGMTAHYNGHHAAAVDWLQKSLAHSTEGESHIRKIYALWTVSVREMGDFEGALAVAQMGLAAVPDDPELLFHQGILCAHLDRLPESAASYERVLSVGKGMYFSSVDSGIFSYKAQHNLAGMYLRMGDYPRARENFLRAMNSNPRFLQSAFDLFHVALKERDWAACETCLHKVAQVEGANSLSLKQMGADYQRALNS